MLALYPTFIPVVYTLATGSAAALMGKTFSWNGSATGPRSYVIETKVD